ncbi:3-deoxy-manno-octulosonate cytidylyltransferase [Leptospira langatensis]|uniref:3-deoxy-manno-octulosonate cytidylyltransferase n=1 Tax=Leptospira langatensis TaxID=2484983 RepID=A0A5F1ZR77_9LEPT|nr:3-deoxy-manno-octulosonate cytidylyltransferase [Leptospira langatensis]TGK02753.1 3-deoxy-manno-octulosonate cytidylyltransferase [Leptospira langatensis]TGL40043.1 3-deoxy-manno-octulosonate cytidylyltransferase [Leptospira langatensis]
MTGPKVLGVIPARFGSSRFPGKPLAMIGNLPMIAWTYKNSLKSSILTEVVVATDDERIRKAVLENGGKVAMTSPDHPSGTDRIREVALQYPEYGIIINVQGDEPGIESELIDGVAKLKLDRKDWAMSTAAVLLEENEISDPNRVKVVMDRNGRALYFSRSPLPSQFKKTVPAYRHLGIYGYDRDFLLGYPELPPSNLEESESLEQLRAMEAGHSIGVYIASRAALSVDTPEDLNIVVEDFKKKGLI